MCQLGTVLTVIGAMLFLVHLFGLDGLDMLGIVCMTFNIVNFGAPMAGMVSAVAPVNQFNLYTLKSSMRGESPTCHNCVSPICSA